MTVNDLTNLKNKCKNFGINYLIASCETKHLFTKSFRKSVRKVSIKIDKFLKNPIVLTYKTLDRAVIN